LRTNVDRARQLDLKEQLALFEKKDGAPSEQEKRMAEVADFFVHEGRLTPEERDRFVKGNFVNDKILKMVASQSN